MHYIDEGPRDGRPVVLVHGNPTAGFVYCNFVGPLTNAGHYLQEDACERIIPALLHFLARPPRQRRDPEPANSSPRSPQPGHRCANRLRLLALLRLAAAQSGHKWACGSGYGGDMSRYGIEGLAEVKRWRTLPVIMSGGHEVVADVGAGGIADVIEAVTEARASKDVRPGRGEYSPVSDVA